MAGRGAGGAGHPGRRPRDRRLPDGDRRGSRHRPGVPLRAVRHRRGGDGAPSCGRGWRIWPPAMLVELLATGPGTPTPQAGWPTYADKIEPADLWLDWSLRRRAAAPGRAVGPGLDHLARVSGCWCWPGGSPTRPAGGGPPGRLEGDVVATGRGGLRLLTVQPEGRGPVAAADWRRGARPRPGRAARVVSRAPPATRPARPANGQPSRPARMRPAGARRLAVDALIAVDGGRPGQRGGPRPARRLRARRPGPSSRHRAGVRDLPDAAGL